MSNSIFKKIFFPFKCQTSQREEVQTVETQQQGLTTNITPINLTSRYSLLLWADKAEVSFNRQGRLKDFDIYDIYRTPFIKKSTADETYIKIQDFYALVETAKANQEHFSVFCIPSCQDMVAKNNKKRTLPISESLDQFSTKDLLDLMWFFSNEDRPIKTGSTRARISICSSAENYKQLIAILASLMHPDHELNEIISQAKILGPGMRHSSTETAILYLDHEKLNDEVFRKFQQILKPLDDGNSKGIPFGMHPLTSFVGYGEQHYEDIINGNSFGESRTEIIHSAIAKRLKKPERSLAETLQEECSKKGLDPLNPAFCSGNYSKFHIEYI